MTSIELYHLDHYKIVDRRQQLYETIKRKLAQAEEQFAAEVWFLAAAELAP